MLFKFRKLVYAECVTAVSVFHSACPYLPSAFFCSCCISWAVSHGSQHPSFEVPCLILHNISMK